MCLQESPGFEATNPSLAASIGKCKKYASGEDSVGGIEYSLNLSKSS